MIAFVRHATNDSIDRVAGRAWATRERRGVTQARTPTAAAPILAPLSESARASLPDTAATRPRARLEVRVLDDLSEIDHGSGLA
jgi:hypothetical protein